MVFFKCIIVSTLHNGDNKYNNISITVTNTTKANSENFRRKELGKIVFFLRRLAVALCFNSAFDKFIDKRTCEVRKLDEPLMQILCSFCVRHARLYHTPIQPPLHFAIDTVVD
jgi:hypothetical protein